MKTLAWDTSTGPTAVALWEADRAVAVDATATEARHGEVLLPRVRALLTRAGWDKREVALLVVGIGPGSFTGLRVGLAAAKGWALATGIPVVGVSSHAAIAGPLLEPDRPVGVVTDAFKGEVYVSVFRQTGEGGAPEPLSEPFNARPDAANTRIAELVAAAGGAAQPCLVGDGLRRYPDMFVDARGYPAELAPPARDVPCPETLARLGLARFREAGATDLHALAPVYVRGSDAKLPTKPLAI